MAWPNPRFTDNSDGTVTDNLTGLIWLQNASCFGVQTWDNALAKANALYDGCLDCGETENDCGLSDGSKVGAWRLPNRKELDSLFDLSQYYPVLPSGNPFSGVQSNGYWSSTSYADGTSRAWDLDLYDGGEYYVDKSNFRYVWPVRGGQ